jgi:hypothetical protein
MWRMGEWENGRMGEWENGRMGEWEPKKPRDYYNFVKLRENSVSSVVKKML